MKYLKTYKLFESKKWDDMLEYTKFVVNIETGDNIQDIINYINRGEHLNPMHDMPFDSPLISAARTHNMYIVNLLIDAGVNYNFISNDGYYFIEYLTDDEQEQIKSKYSTIFYELLKKVNSKKFNL